MKTAGHRRAARAALMALAAAVALGPAEARCASGVPPGDHGDILVTASIGDAMVLNPVLLGDSASGEIVARVFNGLVRYRPDLRLEGELAESFTVENGGLVVVFNLRDGVRWHDGKPFTGRDVKYTYDVLMAPDTKTPYRGNFEKVKSVEVLGPRRVRITYREPFAPALESWSSGMLPEHLLRGRDINTAPFNRAPVGTGPFVFREWRTGEKIALVENRAYFEGRPGLGGFLMKVVPDQPVQFLELQAGNIDLCALTPDLYETRAAAPKFLRRFRRFSYPSFGYTYLGFNLRHPLFRDRRVRTAIALGTDRASLVKGLLRGHGCEITGPFLPESWAANPSVKPLPFDRERALALLAQAGWTRTRGGALVDRTGRRFSFTIVTNQGNRMREQCATAIQWMLGELGMKVEVRIVAWPAFISEFVNKRKFDAVILGWSLGLDPDQYDIWHSSRTGEHEYNFVGYANPEVDRLLETGRTTFDLAGRRKAYRRIHEILARDLPYVFLYAPEALTALDSRFENVAETPIGITYNLHRWYVPRSKQRYALER